MQFENIEFTVCLGYIGKENDVESGLGDFGVRKYNGGRFLSSFINLLTLNSYAV